MPSTSARAAYWRVWNGVIPLRAARDTFDSVAIVLTGTGTSNLSSCSYSMKDGGIAPSTWVVRKNAELKLKNQNAWTHELYADGVRGFDAVATKPREVRKLRIAESLSAPIRDRINAHVQGHLHVLDNLVACGAIGSRGDFSFESVRPGQYTLRMFSHGAELHKATVSISESGKTELAPISLKASTKGKKP